MPSLAQPSIPSAQDTVQPIAPMHKNRSASVASSATLFASALRHHQSLLKALALVLGNIQRVNKHFMTKTVVAALVVQQQPAPVDQNTNLELQLILLTPLQLGQQYLSGFQKMQNHLDLTDL